MSRPMIKVCGITDLHNALAIESLGVEYIGFNFIPSSKRYISPKSAQTIICQFTSAIPVGIFMDQPIDYVNTTIKESGITLAQLHGVETPHYCTQVSVPVIKVFSITDTFDLTILTNYPTKFHLFDAQSGSEKGGTGISFDWSLITSSTNRTPWFLAGGIGPKNIIEATQTPSIFGLDLNSKFEITPGIKSINLLRESIEKLTNK
ncbi:MAG: phosphoribosylanthranilate isomerase [Fibrobacterales bacterium]